MGLFFFTISVHNWLQVLVLGDDVGYLTNCEISVFILLDNEEESTLCHY